MLYLESGWSQSSVTMYDAYNVNHNEKGGIWLDESEKWSTAEYLTIIIKT